MTLELDPDKCLPADGCAGTLIGRVWLPGEGPAIVLLRNDGVFDISRAASTVAGLLNEPDPLAVIAAAPRDRRLGTVADILANSTSDGRDSARPWLLAPIDLQAVKAAGVTFIRSLLERVVEEQARGDPARAAEVRTSLAAEIGLHPASVWNNPEPEIVLAVNAAGHIVGATLGNDVNLRDFEGRSALLLGKAKDNNGSSAIGPFLRLFDDTFSLDDVRGAEVALEVRGPEGYVLNGHSSLAMISRDPAEIVAQAIGPTHQYPDGFALFLGTMFAPIDDRDAPGEGFTHKLGDIVTVASPKLGALVNRVGRSDRIPPWEFGALALMRNLADRGLL